MPSHLASPPLIAHLAIIPPRAEEIALSDYIVSRQMPLHVASLIALLALFVIAWITLTDGPRGNRQANSIKGAR